MWPWQIPDIGKQINLMIRQRLEGIFARRLEDVLKTSWRRLENVLKTSWRGMVNTNILVLIKTSTEGEWLRRIYSSWWRRLQDVFWRRRRKKSSRRLHQDECLLGSFQKLFPSKKILLYSLRVEKLFFATAN